MVQIGFLMDLQNPGPWERPWPQYYGRMLELVEEAERLGAAAVFLGEHHFSDAGYVPQPLTFAAAIAARTSTIRIGTSVLIAPFRHPVHMAEEAAMVDILSGGRLELGLGSGYVPVEYAAFGVDRANRFKLLDAAVAEVQHLLAEVVRPRPIQQPVPLWAAYFGKGARRAGRLGVGLQSLVRPCFDAYREGLAEGGHDPASARMMGPMDLMVSDDPERTRARIQPYLQHHADAYGTLQLAAAEADGRAPFFDGAAVAAKFLILTPDDAIAHIRTVTDGLPVRYVTPWLTLGGTPDDIVEEHLTLTTTKVAPAFAEA